MKNITLEFKWTTSRGRDTYGYNVCTLYADGRKVARCNGGGYDMKGTCLGNYLESAFTDRLRALTSAEMPPQSHWESERARVCDGKCKEEMRDQIAQAILNDKPSEQIQPVKLPEDCFECPTCKGPTRQSRDGKRVNDGRYFYGLRFYDPNYDPTCAKLERADGTFTKPEDVGKTFKQLREEGKIVDLDVIRAAYKQTSPHSTDRHTQPTIDGACGMSSVEQIAKAIGLTLEYVPVKSNKIDIRIMHDAKPELESVAA